ncbi:hypothetical protein GCM10007938_29710 [Vibrio zhanjiangensis]|uniref:histidine kinase n=1 Tax=Vibrio zhanjiangensis TaxID=1046128 RepID=A0ABQ6F2H4_9VIBR|nr:ATP-binding protein [Vibrio zhanjiangensis]GLT19189.1 hypothetical protein GCM10007938_29710 [Vibrio zhanjiangensis]
MRDNLAKRLHLVEYTIAILLAATLTCFFAFKTQNSVLEKIESAFVAHSTSLTHIRSYVQLVKPTDNSNKINQLSNEISELSAELNALEETLQDINGRFPKVMWLGDSLTHIGEEYIQAGSNQLRLLGKMLPLKYQQESFSALYSFEQEVFSDTMDEAIEHLHENLIHNIFLTNDATVYALILSTCLLFSTVLLYLNLYISELKETKLALQQAANQAEEASTAKSMFLATMSHEIRTPMNGVIGITQLLRSENKDPNIQPDLDTLLESGEHLMAVINEILDFSKLDQGNIELLEEVFPAEQLLVPIRNAFCKQASDKNIQLIFDTEGLPDELILRGDKARIRQIIYNLVGNAVKFTSEGKVSVKLNYDQNTEEFTVCVADTGIGIPDTRTEGIFNPFEQADATTMHNYGGTGLGLSIVKELCMAMKGTILVESELGVGSCFTAKISVLQGSSSQLPKEFTSGENLAGISVLIVEDNRINQIVAKRLCEKLGLTTSIACTGVEAIKKVEHSSFDVILMDHQMPEMGGIEATKLIRRKKMFSGVILGCTADVTLETAEAYEDAGADGVITKPLRLEALKKSLIENFAEKRTAKN